MPVEPILVVEVDADDLGLLVGEAIEEHHRRLGHEGARVLGGEGPGCRQEGGEDRSGETARGAEHEDLLALSIPEAEKDGPGPSRVMRGRHCSGAG